MHHEEEDKVSDQLTEIQLGSEASGTASSFHNKPGAIFKRASTLSSAGHSVVSTQKSQIKTAVDSWGLQKEESKHIMAAY